MLLIFHHPTGYKNLSGVNFRLLSLFSEPVGCSKLGGNGGNPQDLVDNRGKGLKKMMVLSLCNEVVKKKI